MNKKVQELENDALYEQDFPEIPPSDVIAYNELRSCADLVRMHRQNILIIQPEFQRDFVWKEPDQTRFIDSLVKQLPIPSMCFSLDYKTQKWQVIDGLQRISTIIRFLTEDKWRLSNLEDIDQRLSGQRIENLRKGEEELQRLYSSVENRTLPITILRCDYSKKSHTNFLFTIFHRLNTGGMKLNNQEIRNCIYSGSFNNLLKELDHKNKEWRAINRMKAGQSYRFIKQELILRIFALHERCQQYTGRLAKFLNDYMDDKKNASDSEISQKKELFEKTAKIVYEKVFNKKQPPSKITITLLEAIFVGVSFNLDFLETVSIHKAEKLYVKLQQHEEFSEAKLSEGLSGKPRVIERINAAKNIFSGQ